MLQTKQSQTDISDGAVAGNGFSLLPVNHLSIPIKSYSILLLCPKKKAVWAGVGTNSSTPFYTEKRARCKSQWFCGHTGVSCRSWQTLSLLVMAVTAFASHQSWHSVGFESSQNVSPRKVHITPVLAFIPWFFKVGHVEPCDKAWLLLYIITKDFFFFFN